MTNETNVITIDNVWADFTAGLRRFIASRVSDLADVDDVLQEVLIKVHYNLEKLEDLEKLSSWIYQIARNAIIDHHRKQNNLVSCTDELPDVPIEDLSAEAVEMEVASWLKPMTLLLPEEYRQALLLTDIEGLTQKELADKLGISLSGAKSRVQRARGKLKDELLACCNFEFDRRGRVIDWELKQSECVCLDDKNSSK